MPAVREPSQLLLSLLQARDLVLWWVKNCLLVKKEKERERRKEREKERERERERETESLCECVCVCEKSEGL
jgi:hypothetical protein